MKDPKSNSIPTLFPNSIKAYQMRSPQSSYSKLMVIASVDKVKNALREHVSVHGIDQHGNKYTPSWTEMAFIKDVFFDEEDIVVQIHPKKSQYVNAHENVLHLWRDTDNSFNTIFE